ncbi:sulfotransferase [Rhizohabitans arisaemae]|uniref:sulfotransferase n=1 Tax=Rhizohabitans arisaemae TaxID=2720610 RepID=UPI0024B07F1A|nr:sulfotransferase [Rhizohabitans arisaemae]
MSPILVTGLPRSGTSWVGRMLHAGGRLVYVNEPLNPQHPPGRRPGVLNASVTHRFQYICDDNDELWLPAFQRTLALRYGLRADLRRNRSPGALARSLRDGTAFLTGRLRGRQALLDDPFALFSTRWFTERLGCRVVVLIRNPVAFVGSWQRLGWTVYFHELLEQPLLVRDLLGPWAPELRAHVGSQDRIAKAALLWRTARAVVRPIPGVRLVRYEDLVRAPLEGFRDLYDWCGLEWTARARARIAAACSGDGDRRPFAWHGLSRTAFRPMNANLTLTSYLNRLSTEEITRIQELTGTRLTTPR